VVRRQRYESRCCVLLQLGPWRTSEVIRTTRVGEFPDNVTSLTAPDATTSIVQLTKAYTRPVHRRPLATWMALPQQTWDETSASGPIGDYDETTSGPRRSTHS